LNDFKLYEGYYFDVREVKFTLTEPVSIKFLNHLVVRDEVSADEWRMAKVHLQAELPIDISFLKIIKS